MTGRQMFALGFIAWLMLAIPLSILLCKCIKVAQGEEEQ